MRRLLQIPMLLPLLALGCARTVYSDTDTDTPPDDLAEQAWLPVTAALDAAAADAPDSGMTLIVWDREGTLRYRHTVGGFEPDVRIPIASSSKLVSALVLLRMVEAGDLSLNDTTAGVLGWQGTHGTIQLDHTGSFVTGLPAKAPCTSVRRTTLAECVQTMSELELQADPEQRFDYGSTHLAVGARMAEVRAGQSWNEVFAQRLASPLGLTDPGLTYVTHPKNPAAGDNPLVAGGLMATVDEYRVLLDLVLQDGILDGQRLLAPALIERLHRNPYAAAAIGQSPYQQSDIDYRYGFGTWLECEGAAESCDVISSAGAFGFTPWVDRDRDYAAILAMEGDLGAGSGFAVPLQQQVRPLVEQALAQ